MTGPAYNAGWKSRALTTMAEMITSNIGCNVRPKKRAVSLRICGQIAKGRHDQPLVAQAGFVAEILMGLREDIDNIGFRRRRKANVSHVPLHLTVGHALMPSGRAVLHALPIRLPARH